jgi:hypothetical protein
MGTSLIVDKNALVQCACGGRKTNRTASVDGAVMLGFDLALFELLMHIQESAPFLIVPDVFMG